jgi:hypothetical protein
MFWTDTVVKDFAEHLARCGLSTCPVCSSGTLGVNPAPVQLSWRGPAWVNAGEPGYDPNANILFMFLVVCDFCSHAMLFDSERFSSRDTPVLRAE